ncbi:MAG: hypothetical protein RRC07_01220 [Anaerolineae bacterium]|nr:hypothetical protein [Anaerolineae bacterium]
MGRSLLLLIVLLFSSIILASAQGEPVEGEVITVARDPDGPGLFGPIDGVWEPIELEPVAAPEFPAVPGAHGADTCEAATQLTMEHGTDGDFIAVNDMTVSASDPILSCMWGQPISPRGNRTVWYKFVAPASGHLVVYTDFNPSDYDDSYDTVLALYESPDGTCDSLQMLACNDDYSGFFSKVTNFIIEGRTYYIEVADWHFSSQQAAYLRLAVVLEEGPSNWERFDWDPGSGDDLWLPRTRHMVVTDGNFIYIIGGETEVTEFSSRDGAVRRFDPRTGESVGLYPMPGVDDPWGYSRTDAALINGKIYVPSGYVGNNSAYGGSHFTYVIAQDRWLENDDPPVPWGSASPTGQPYAWAQLAAAPGRGGYYMAGGLLSGDPDPSEPADAEPTGRLLFYNTVNKTWVTNLPDMESARYAHVAALLQTPRGPEVCVAGGVGKVDDTTAAALATTECFNINSGSWSNRAPLNFARFAADSAVGPDGRWYIFGGINASLGMVTSSEVYNPATDTWQVLDSRFSISNPGRALAQGVFVGNNLWIFGGEMWSGVVGGQRQILVVPLMERMFLPSTASFMPMFSYDTMSIEPNEVMARAWPINLNEPQWHDFAGQEDYFDIYRWNIPAPGRYEVVVSNIPRDHDYNIYLYDENKMLVGYGVAVGNQTERAITLPLVTGRDYYAVVVRVFGAPTAEQYQIVVRPYVP